MAESGLWAAKMSHGVTCWPGNILDLDRMGPGTGADQEEGREGGQEAMTL